MNIFKKLSSIFQEETLPPKSKEAENQEIISIYHQIKRAVPDYDEPNYTLAEKVFREFNDFNLKNINEINCHLIPIPKSLLPYPKNYIKCAYYLFLENAKKQKDLKMFNLIQEVGCSLFFGDYPDYDKYKKALLNNKKWEHMLFDKTKNEEEIESLKKLIAKINDGRENFRKQFGVYEISEADYNASPNSIDCTDEKLIYDFGFLPEIEQDVDMDKIIKNTKK
jgi:hypothetical protein